jgi:uncharacterized membrane protein
MATSNSKLEFSWTVSPYRENNIRLGIIIAIILAFLIAVFFMMNKELAWVAIAGIIFILALHKFFFNTTYTFSEKLKIEHLKNYKKKCLNKQKTKN